MTLPSLLMMASLSAQAGFSEGGSSVTFTGLSPTNHTVLLDGVALSYVPRLSGFVAIGVAPGSHRFQLATRSGLVVFEATYSITDGTHEDCLLVEQGGTFTTRCSKTARSPYTPSIFDNSALSVTPTVPTPPPPVAWGAPMSDGSFHALMYAVKEEPFTSDQLDMVRIAAARSRFTCAQVVGLMGIFDFTSEKFEVLQILQPSVIDPQNMFIIEASFHFSSEKKKVREIFLQ